jgi:Mn2+/Fe2+ NRAMP family transporter
MSDQPTIIEKNKQAIVEAHQKGPVATFLTYTRLSGPGWLQSAITLGGGSLAGALYLGVISGYSLLWVQALAMIMGIVMLSAISWFTLSTGKRPFRAINDHVNPVLGWGWAIATLLANMVWCLPQFALATDAISQNLFPQLSGEAGLPGSTKAIIVGVVFVLCAVIVHFYERGSRGVQIFEIILKFMVAIVVISFFATVFKLTFSGNGLPWGEILSGFIPDFRYFTQPSETFTPFLDATGEFSSFWKEKIVSSQQDIMITAAATAVGINMTFLLPYSMLKKGWSREYRGLAIFDLSTGLFIPYILATSCVVIASASQFHGVPQTDTVGNYNNKGYMELLQARVIAEHNASGAEGAQPLSAEDIDRLARDLPGADQEMAAMLVKQSTRKLADSLSPITTETFGNKIFGVGVLGMAVSTIIILMLINGFTVCEMLNIKPEGTPHYLGALAVGLVGMCGPFIWSKAGPELAVPTSVFGFALLPIAFITFFILVNHKGLMGEHRPRGTVRLVWNGLMVLAVSYATIGALSRLSKTSFLGIDHFGIYFVILLVLAAAIVHKIKPPKKVDQIRKDFEQET